METVNNYLETDLGNVAPNPQGEYVAGKTYEYLDLVTVQGSSYLCVIESTSAAPVKGQNSKEWQIVSLSGNLTPEYIAMHDDVVSKATEVASNTAVVEATVQNVSGIEANIEAIQKDVQSSQRDIQKNKDIVVGVEKAVRLSEQNVKENEQNVNAQINSFNQLVLDKTQQATTEIDSARQAAVGAVTKQQELSIAEVKTQTSQYITEQKESAKQEIDATKRGVVQAVTNEGIKQKKILTDTTAGEVKKITDEGATQLGAVRQEGTTQVETVAAEGVKQKGILDDTVQAIIADRKQITQNRDDIVKLQIKETAIGKAISVSDSAEFPFVDYKVFGETEQVVSTGKNLFNKEQTTQIDVDGKGSMRNGVKTDLPAGDYFVSVDDKTDLYVKTIIGGVYSSNLGVTNKINLTSNGSIIVYTSQSSDFIKSKQIQLEKGTKVTPYEPYTGGKPSPSIEYPSPLVSKTLKEIKVTGKNLFDFSKCNYQDSIKNQIEYKNMGNGLISVKGRTNNQNCSLSLSYSMDMFYFSSGVYSTKRYNLTGGDIEFWVGCLTKSGRRFNIDKENTVVDEAFKIISAGIFVNKQITENINVLIPTQLVYESEIGEFEPYKEQVVTLSQPITLNGMKVKSNGNYIDENGQQWLCDYIDFKQKTHIQQIKSVTLDGTEQWSINPTAQSKGKYIFSHNTGNTFLSIDSYILCDKMAASFWYPTNFEKDMIMSSSGYILVYLKDQSINTEVEFKNWLKTNNLTVEYILSTPVKTPLPQADQQALEKLHTFYPNTVIMTNDSTGQELTYVADTKNYIDKKLNQIVKANVRSTANLLSLMPLDTQASMIENDTNNILHDMEVQKHE